MECVIHAYRHAFLVRFSRLSWIQRLFGRNAAYTPTDSCE